MDLIDRYVQETAHRVPRKARKDVARELRSSLEDSLESRAGVPIEQVDEETAVELLREFGKPQDVADSYRTGPKHLIGPEHYAGFVRTMKYGLVIGGSLITIGALLDVAGSSGDLGELGRIGARFITNIQTGFLALLGLIVLIFALIERGRSVPWATEKDWDPRDLPPIAAEAHQVDRTGTVVGVVLAAAGLLLLNIYPDWVRIHLFSDGEQLSVPLLGSVSRTEVLTLNIYLLLSVLLGVVILAQRRWRLGTRIADAGVSGFLVLFLFRLWTKADHLLPDRSDLLDAGWPVDEATNFAEVGEEVLSPLLWWLLLAGLLVAAWVSIRKILTAVETGMGQSDGGVA